MRNNLFQWIITYFISTLLSSVGDDPDLPIIFCLYSDMPSQLKHLIFRETFRNWHLENNWKFNTRHKIAREIIWMSEQLHEANPVALLHWNMVMASFLFNIISLHRWLPFRDSHSWWFNITFLSPKVHHIFQQFSYWFLYPFVEAWLVLTEQYTGPSPYANTKHMISTILPPSCREFT